MAVLRGVERWLLPAMAVVGFVWLVGSPPEPEPVAAPKGRIAGAANGVILWSELPRVLDSALVGLYNENDSLIYSGTPAQMEAYLASVQDSLKQTVPKERGVLP